MKWVLVILTTSIAACLCVVPPSGASALLEAGAVNDMSITMVFVGSRKVDNNDDVQYSKWEALGNRLTVVGFEGDTAECERINTQLEKNPRPWREWHFPKSLWRTASQQTLYITKQPSCSSLLPPHKENVARFAGYADVMTVVDTRIVQTTTLDHFWMYEIKDVGMPDVLQLDVQGADLAVLEGADYILSSSVLAVQVEVEFLQHYEGQPLFADVDLFMRRQGFSLFTTTRMQRLRRSSSGVIDTDRDMGNGQLSYTDAVYMRDVLLSSTAAKWKTPETMLKLAFIADVFHQTDYTMELMEALTVQYGATDKRYNLLPAAENLFQIAQGLNDPSNAKALRNMRAAVLQNHEL